MPHLAGSRERVLWTGVASLGACLGALVWMQYRSLSEAEQTAAEAEGVRYGSYLQAVAGEIRSFYRGKADQILTVPAPTRERLPQQAAEHLRRHPWRGARELFLWVAAREGPGTLLVYDRERGGLLPTPDLGLAAAVSRSWAEHQAAPALRRFLDSYTAFVDEEDSRYRLVYRPLLDPGQRVIGLSGLVLDQAFFEGEYLKEAVRKALDPACEAREFTVSVRFGRYPAWEHPPVLPPGYHSMAIGPFFGDAHLVMKADAEGPASWARSSFRLSVLLSTLAAAGLLAGLSLALRSASQAVRLSQARTDFVSNVSHELRTPLSSIRVLAEFLGGGRVGDPAKVVEYGRLIETEARRMIGLVETVLDFARLEAEGRPAALAPGRLEEVVTEAVAAFTPRAREAGFDLALETGDGHLPAVLLDRRALGEAVTNLVDNAIKYSGESRRVVVRLDGDGREARVSVEDRGIGIPAPEQGRIFEKFYRVGNGAVHDVKGAGLGLARVAQAVKGHRGHVSVRSRPGEGSTFTIHLPAAEAAKR